MRVDKRKQGSMYYLNTINMDKNENDGEEENKD